MQQNKKKIRNQLMSMPIMYHIIAAVILLCLLVFLVLRGLNIYTRHNMAIVIPDVKGLQLADASIFLKNSNLNFTVIDSVYTKDVAPGAIVDIIPPIGSKVKDGRIVFITLNAREQQKGVIPNVVDISFRQAYALMQSLGFTDIEVKYVEGQYLDLVLGVESGGRNLDAGTQAPLSSKLVLKVSSGKNSSSGATPDTIQSGEEPQ
ncbi:MAG: PASTA domain-containing protein [Tannerella sp.]|jgi:beta-lactam-binding protein with PASTA domain|nr:PASTA domain-containing protein [Tannerella sp.]